MKKKAKKRRSARPPNYFRRVVAHPGDDDDHPIDVAVRRRLPQKAAQQRLRGLQRTVETQLEGNLGTFLELETLRNNISIEREEAYFSVGYEYGLADGLARARPSARSKKAKRLARELHALMVQAQLPPGEVVLALCECLGAALSTSQEMTSRADSGAD